MKADILAFGAHPDDIELACVGTLLKHIDKGYRISLVDLTMGELGTRGSGELRLEEAEASRKLMGAQSRHNLDLGDGFFERNETTLKAVAEMIRKYQPEVILANSLIDRHPDHARGAKLVSDACFISGLVKVDIKGLQPWRPRAVYHYIQDRNITADFCVDISDYMEQKLTCIKAFGSQFYQEHQDSDEPETPISTKNFFDYVKAKDRTNARPIKAEYAESFNVGRIPGIDDLMHLL